MKIKNPEKRIKELNKKVSRLKRLIALNNRFDIKLFNKESIKNKSEENIIQTLNGQAHFLGVQKRKLVEQRWETKEIIIELIHLYKYTKELKKKKRE